MLESSWSRCWKLIGADGTGQALMLRLIDAYKEPHRKYHTVQHLKECLTIYNDYLDCAQESDEVEIVLWFHDAIYNVKASDNEEKSAEWAVHELRRAAVSPERIARVKDHILATRHSALPKGRDQELLVDIDLSILGAEPERFKEYERQVREEYSYIPGVIFRRNRKKILKKFLDRCPIYSTLKLRQRFEDRARENLALSISEIED
jgi:predicted metal-dependent HD superfamily phosphohydrolase